MLTILQAVPDSAEDTGVFLVFVFHPLVAFQEEHVYSVPPVVVE